jgi:hypothetical protein
VILRVSSLLCKVCIHNMNTVWKPAETQLALWLGGHALESPVWTDSAH